MLGELVPLHYMQVHTGSHMESKSWMAVMAVQGIQIAELHILKIPVVIVKEGTMTGKGICRLKDIVTSVVAIMIKLLAYTYLGVVNVEVKNHYIIMIVTLILRLVQNTTTIIHLGTQNHGWYGSSILQK